MELLWLLIAVVVVSTMVASIGGYWLDAPRARPWVIVKRWMEGPMERSDDEYPLLVAKLRLAVEALETVQCSRAEREKIQHVLDEIKNYEVDTEGQ